MKRSDLGILILVFTLLASCTPVPKDLNEQLTPDSQEVSTPSEKDANEVDGSPFVVEDEKADASYYFLLAELSQLQGKPEIAEDHYEKAYDLDQNEYLAEKYMTSHLSLNPIDESFMQLKKMVLLYPKSIPLRTMLINQLLGENDYSAALEQLEMSHRIYPNNASVLLQAIKILNMQGNSETAHKKLIELTKTHPNNQHAWLLLAQLHLRDDNYRSALKALDRSHELSPSSPENIILLIYTLNKLNDHKRLFTFMEKLFIETVDYKRLLIWSKLFQTIFTNSNSALAFLQQFEQSNLSQIENFELIQIILLWDLKEFKKASQKLEYLIAINQKSARLHYLAGLGYEQQQNLPLAQNHFERVSHYSNYFIPSQEKLLILNSKYKPYEEIKEQIHKVLNYEYLTWDFYLFAAELLSQLQHPDDAVHLLQRGYKQFPSETELLFSAGVYQEKNGDIEACIATMKEVIKQNPQYSSAYNYLGYLYADRNTDLHEAEKLLKKALVLKPGDGYYLDSLGWIYYKMAKYDTALIYLIKALKAKPNESIIWEHAGDAYLSINKNDYAIKFYSNALKLAFEEKDKKRIEEKIEKLSKAA